KPATTCARCCAATFATGRSMPPGRASRSMSLLCRRTRLALAAALGLGAGLAGPATAATAVPDAMPGQDWRTVRSGSIIVHFSEAGRPWAEIALPVAERAFAALGAFVGRTPRGDIHIVVVPDGDLTNGLATPL